MSDLTDLEEDFSSDAADSIDEHNEDDEYDVPEDRPLSQRMLKRHSLSKTPYPSRTKAKPAKQPPAFGFPDPIERPAPPPPGTLKLWGPDGYLSTTQPHVEESVVTIDTKSYLETLPEPSEHDLRETPESARDRWQLRSNCLGVDPSLFYPERGASTREAKQVCQGCVVREECLEYALSNGEKFGIWGGLSERERRRIRRQRARDRAAQAARQA